MHRRSRRGQCARHRKVFSTLRVVADHVVNAYYASEWDKLLDVGHDRDEELHRAWVPERIRRDLDAASFYRTDLAKRPPVIDAVPTEAPI